MIFEQMILVKTECFYHIFREIRDELLRMIEKSSLFQANNQSRKSLKIHQLVYGKHNSFLSKHIAFGLFSVSITFYKHLCRIFVLFYTFKMDLM